MQQSVSLLSLSKQTQLLLLPVGQEVDVSTEEEGGEKNVWSSISKGLKTDGFSIFTQVGILVFDTTFNQ